MNEVATENLPLGPVRGDQAASPPETATTKQMIPQFKIIYRTADLTMSPPENAIVIHSVNCQAEWGSGVALDLRTKFPKACKFYQARCTTRADQLLGTCLLIPPQKEEKGGSRWIACLFVSEGYGRRTKVKAGRSSRTDIMAYTKRALSDLRVRLEAYRQDERLTPRPNVDELWACKFNSGSFAVPWEATVEIITEVFDGWDGQMKIACRELAHAALES